MPKQIPTTIVTGFLGSGKTTIISNLTNYLQKISQKVVFIKNELGFEDIDTQIIKDRDIKTKELLNGVVYHTLTGPLNNTINDLIKKFNPDRIIIETAGTEHSSDPLKIGLMIDNHPLLIRDGLITIIDVVNFNAYEHLDDYNKDKANFVDLIVFNKIELVNQKRKEAVVGYVREYNEHSPIVEAPSGKLDPNLAFGINFANKQIDKNEDESEIDTFVFNSNKTFNKTKLEHAFLKLPKNVIRYKGYIRTQFGMEIVNGVFKRFNWLSKSENNSINETKLIIIGYKVKSNESEIHKILNSCES